MSLPEDFRKNLAEKTDQQLFDIVAHAVDYVPEAIEAVQKELSARNLSADHAAVFQAAAEQKCAEESRLADLPLSGPARVLIVLLSGSCLPALLWVTVLSGRYRSKGYETKADQCWGWFWIGTAFWSVVALLLLIIKVLSGETSDLAR